MKQDNNDTSMSLSKQRKLQRMHDIKKQKKEAVTGKIIGIIIAIAVVVGIIALAVALIVRAATRVTADNGYSTQLTEDGTIKNVVASDYVTPADYKNITIPYADIAYTDEQMEKEISNLLEQNAELDNSKELVAKNGDKVNIDYVGTVDGTPFEGGNTLGNGSDVYLGSGSLIDDFEAQIEGHKPGDSFDVNVTFPQEYPNNPDVAGKDAVFSVVLNGIYKKPEFNDKFVLKHLGDYALTADAYREYLRSTNEDKSLVTKLLQYLVENSTVSSYPKAYLEQIKAIKKFEDLAYFENLNNYYTSMLGGPLYPTFSSYLNMTEAEYDRSLKATGQAIAKQTLVLLAIAEKEGIKADEATYLAYALEQGSTEESFNNDLATYGKGYIMQQHIIQQVLDLVKGMVTVQR